MANKPFEVQGLSELRTMLQQLPVRIERNIMRGALRAGANVIRDSARLAAPVDDGLLRKSIKTGSSKVRFNNVIVSVETKLFYARMIEFGTASFYTGQGRSVKKPYRIPKAKGKRIKKALAFGNVIVNNVTHPGIKPQPFMRKAFDSSKEKAIENFRAFVSSRLAAEAAKK